MQIISRSKRMNLMAKPVSNPLKDVDLEDEVVILEDESDDHRLVLV